MSAALTDDKASVDKPNFNKVSFALIRQNLITITSLSQRTFLSLVQSNRTKYRAVIAKVTSHYDIK